MESRFPAAVWVGLWLGGLWMLGGVGCATGDVEMLTTISGGQQLRVPISRGGPVFTQEGGVQINVANFTLNPDKKLIYTFAFTDSRSRALRSVRVEDVSDDAPIALLQDPDAKLAAGGQWAAKTDPLELADPRLGWLTTISSTLRVYRFTITFADGQTLVLHQGTLFSAMMKTAMRQALGQNY